MSEPNLVRDTRKSVEELNAAFEAMSARDFAGIRRSLEEPEKPLSVVSAARARNLFSDQVELLLLRYSLGHDVTALAALYPGIVSAWEFKFAVDRAALDVVQQGREHNYALRREMYQWALWMVSLGILLEASDDDFAKVVSSLDGVNDRILDRLIATRVPKHLVAEEVLWPKPFALLEAVLDAPGEERAALMMKFVKSWFTQSRKNYWWGNHELSPNVAAKYFGYWNVEAAAAVAAFGIDDSAFLDNEYYPADLVPARWKK